MFIGWGSQLNALPSSYYSLLSERLLGETLMNYLAHRAPQLGDDGFSELKPRFLEFATRRVGPSTDFIALNCFLLDALWF